MHRQQPAIAARVYARLKYTPDGSIDPRAMEVVVRTPVEVGALDTAPSLADLYPTQSAPVERR